MSHPTSLIRLSNNTGVCSLFLFRILLSSSGTPVSRWLVLEEGCDSLPDYFLLMAVLSLSSCSPFSWFPSEFSLGSLIRKCSWRTAGLSHDGPSNLWALACFINMSQSVFPNHIWSKKKKSAFKFFQWTMFNFLHLDFPSKPIKNFRNLVLMSPFWNFWDPFMWEILLADFLNKTLICWVCFK